MSLAYIKGSNVTSSLAILFQAAASRLYHHLFVETLKAEPRSSETNVKPCRQAPGGLADFLGDGDERALLQRAAADCQRLLQGGAVPGRCQSL